MTDIIVPSLLWYGNKAIKLTFPDEWKINVCHMHGYNLQHLTINKIRQKIYHPIGKKRLSKLAKEKEEAVILFDDLTRPTQARYIVPYVLEELRRAGIMNDHIRFVCATGAHAPCNRIDFSKKLGEDIVEQYPIYNHNPFHNLTYVGETTYGTPVEVNSEVIECDLKIGIGCIIPHPMTGFTGGAKIVMPGVASIRSIIHNHCDIGNECFDRISTTGWRDPRSNDVRRDMEEFAKMIELDFKIDVLVNERGEIIDLVSGDFVKGYERGIELGKQIYKTKLPGDKADIVIANTYMKANQAVNGLRIAMEAVKEGGVIVLIANAPEGQNMHYLYGKFGKKRGGMLWSTPPVYQKNVDIIVYSQYIEKDPLLEIADPETLEWAKDWSEVIELLKNRVSSSPKVTVFPCAGIQVPSYTFEQ